MLVLKTFIALVVVHELSALVPGVYVAKGMKEEEEREKDQMKELLQKQHIARLKEEEREEEQQRKLAILQKEQLDARQKLLITTKEIDKLLAAGKITKNGATDLRLGLKSASDEELAKYRTWLSEIEEAEAKAIAEEKSKDKRMDEEDDEEVEEELVEKKNRGVENDLDKEIAKIIKELNSVRKQDNLKKKSETNNPGMSKQIQNPVKAQELGVNSAEVRVNPPKNIQAKAPNNVSGKAPSTRVPPNIQAAAIPGNAKANQPYAARTSKPPAPKADNRQAVQANPGSAAIPGKAKANQPYAPRTSKPTAPKADNRQAVKANQGSAALRATSKPSQQKLKPATPADIGAAAVQPAAPPTAQVPIKLANAPVNRPTKAPVNRPTKAPVNRPAEAPVNRPTKAPVQTIVQPGNIPVVIAVDAPRNPSAVKEPNDTPVKKIELKAPNVVGANAPYIYQPNIPANPPVFVSRPVVGRWLQPNPRLRRLWFRRTLCRRRMTTRTLRYVIRIRARTRELVRSNRLGRRRSSADVCSGSTGTSANTVGKRITGYCDYNSYIRETIYIFETKNVVTYTVVTERHWLCLGSLISGPVSILRSNPLNIN